MANNIVLWLQTIGIRILLITVAGMIAQMLLSRANKAFLTSILSKHVVGSRSDLGQKKRIDTLSQVITKTSAIIISLVALLMILTEIGINITPILTGAGIIGIAIGFGAQDMVRNIFHGIFILLEDQYSEGDIVSVAGVSGTVEEFDLRKTTIRDLDGVQHHIPNGEITIASNKTKGWSGINLDIGVAYSTNLDKLKEVIEQTCKDFNEKHEDIIQTPELVGIDKFADSAIIIKILGKTKPGAQWDMSRKLRASLKEVFDKEGIEIPFPHQVEIQKKEF